VTADQEEHEHDYTRSALADRLDALELRVRELEDERALRDLLTLYSFGADVFRGPPWVGLFTDDGSYDLGSQNVDGAYSGRFTGPDDLRKALMSRPAEFVQTMTEKFLIYALGRGLEPYDMPTVRKIVRDVSGDNYRFSSIVMGIVKSAPFQMERVPEAAPKQVQVASAQQ